MSTFRQQIYCDFNSTKTLGCNHSYSKSRLASCWLPLANSAVILGFLRTCTVVLWFNSGPLVSKDHCSGPLACPHVKGALIKWANIALQKSNFIRVILSTEFALVE